VGRVYRPPDGWITLHLVARAKGLGHYPRLVRELCELWPRVPVRRFRRSGGAARCVRVRDLERLGERIDRWLDDPKWTRFALRRTRRRRRRKRTA
jgi:hypothetical protein